MNTLLIDNKSLNYEDFNVCGDCIKINVEDDYFIETKVISKILDKQIKFFEKYKNVIETALNSTTKHEFYFDIEISKNEKYVECFILKVDNNPDNLIVTCKFNKSVYCIEI